ncbi:MAG: putative inner membrane protein [Pseudomonadota bacterium]
MSTGLIALLDDVASLAKIAAASLDDMAAHAGKAGAKAAGVVVDDAAVTPRYVVGFSADRELPIIGRIAVGSLKNKLLILLPAALLLSWLAPWSIMPLLMLGGAFLCYEGAEKAYEALWPHAEPHGPGGILPDQVTDPAALEAEKVRGAIKTDFILSAEIMAITLSTVAADSDSIWTQAAVLVIVAIAITVVVYGVVALIVKADDVGVALARTSSGTARAIGRGLVLGMPVLLKLLSVVGTLAMLWVGGGIIVHGLAALGAPGIEHAIHGIAHGAAHTLPLADGFESWIVTAGLSGLLGLALGALSIPVIHRGIEPMVARLRKGRAGGASS